MRAFGIGPARDVVDLLHPAHRARANAARALAEIRVLRRQQRDAWAAYPSERPQEDALVAASAARSRPGR